MYERSFRVNDPGKPKPLPGRAGNLRNSIEQNLRYLSRNRSEIAEVLDEDPEKLAAAPLGRRIAEFQIPAGLDAGDVQDAIILAGLDRKYTVVSRTRGHAAIRLVHKGIVVTHRFTYDDSTVRMYTEAHNQSGKGEPVEVDGWGLTLAKSVQIQLTRKTL